MTNTGRAGRVRAGPGRWPAYAVFLVGAGLCAWGLWLLAVSWFGDPERLLTLSESDRKSLAEHDRQIENLRQFVFGQRQAPQTATETHQEAADLERVVFHGAGGDDARANAALNLVRLQAQRFFVAQLWEEKVARAREQQRFLGYGLVGTGSVGFALMGWAVRRWRQTGRAKAPQPGPHDRAGEGAPETGGVPAGNSR
jgi:hypothetical protein